MSSKFKKMPVMSALPIAYFVNGDTGLEQTTESSMGGRYLEAEPIAAIVPIPEAVVDDARVDVWAQPARRARGGGRRALDAAIFFGTNKPRPGRPRSFPPR